MRQKIFVSLLLFIAFLLHPKATEAAEASPSQQECLAKIAQFLTRRASPLAVSTSVFVEVANENNLNCYLLPAISGVESGFGKAIRPGSYNPFGWNNGKYKFESWDQSIRIVGTSLGKKYGKRWGAWTPEKIGRYYATDPNWPRKVRFHMARIQAQALN